VYTPLKTKEKEVDDDGDNVENEAEGSRDTIFIMGRVKVKVKKSVYRPGQAVKFPGSRGSQILRRSAHEGDKVVSPTHLPSLPPRKYSWYSFLLEAELTPRS